MTKTSQNDPIKLNSAGPKFLCFFFRSVAPIKTVTLVISSFEVTELKQLKHEVGPNLAQGTPQCLWNSEPGTKARRSAVVPGSVSALPLSVCCVQSRGPAAVQVTLISAQVLNPTPDPEASRPRRKPDVTHGS